MSGNPTPTRNESWWINYPVSSFIGDTILKYNVVSQKIPRGTEPQLSTLATHSLMLAYIFGFLLFSLFPTAPLMLSGHLPNKIHIVISLSQSLLLGKFKLKKTILPSLIQLKYFLGPEVRVKKNHLGQIQKYVGSIWYLKGDKFQWKFHRHLCADA